MIHLYIIWYDRNPDFSPNYSSSHFGTIYGETPRECMKRLNEQRLHHDLSKYTPMEISFIY